MEFKCAQVREGWLTELAESFETLGNERRLFIADPLADLDPGNVKNRQ